MLTDIEIKGELEESWAREVLDETTLRTGKFHAKDKYIQHWALMLAPLRWLFFLLAVVCRLFPRQNHEGLSRIDGEVYSVFTKIIRMQRKKG